VTSLSELTITTIAIQRIPSKYASIKSRTWFKSFNGNWCCIVPNSFVDLAKLSMTNLTQKSQGRLRNFPVVFCIIGKTDSFWFFNLRNGKFEVQLARTCHLPKFISMLYHRMSAIIKLILHYWNARLNIQELKQEAKNY
jgi:hypothetical protein